MGKGAYICIQNKSTHSVTLSVEDRVQVDDVGMDFIQGTLHAGGTLPSDGGEDKFGNGRRYQYIEGDKSFFLQPDGSFKLVVSTDGSSPAFTTLHVGATEWFGGECTAGSEVMVSTDVDENDDQFRIEIRIFNSIRTQSWMGDLAESIKDKPLCQVGLPGTHDSGTFMFDQELGASPDSDLTMTIQDKLDGAGGRGLLGSIGSVINDTILGTVFTSLCKTQDKSIKEQLEGGIRYLDLRVVRHEENGNFYTCHGVFCVDMKTVIDDINEFLNENEKEIVLLDFNHLFNMDGHHKEFLDSILATLGDKVAKFSKLKADSPVEDYWKAGAQVVILYCGDQVIGRCKGKVWAQSEISSPWPNATDISILHDKLNESVENRSKDKFFVLQGLLTPDANLVKEEILANNVSTSLETIAKRVSSKVVGWIEQEWYEQIQNVVIVDFFEKCSMVPTIINWNRK